MKTPTRKIQYKYGDIIRIKPIFDVHLGVVACDENAFKNYLKDSDDKTYFIGGGDLFDSIIVPDKRYRKSGDATVGDDIIDQQIQRGYELLLPYRERILGLAVGNHEDTITKRCGTNPIKRLCRKLNEGITNKIENLGFSGLFRLRFTEGGHRTRTVIIRYHHGWGGGSRTQGADLTKFSKDTMYWDADLFLYGHVHRKQTDAVPRMGMSGDLLISKPKILCICGTYLKTYTKGSDPTYSEICGYPPVEIGGVVIEIKPQNKWVKIKAYLD